ncbi:DUF2752 domain-containing protein [Anatilimnocola floriformis]|uniref:DUF2752 domain-containing protein n=1 Tax=Anatilimnocola floriformis TaxID=2948575 RepID=UPI0020C3DA20|nr:DUF2752 domain-containing protein [Anatilimnocola floriformis]
MNTAEPPISVQPPKFTGESPFAGHDNGRIVLWQRGLLFFTGLTLITLLVIAASLHPSPNGLGTHQQLGLPPCSSITLFGIRCPACGMTTSWSHLMHGHVLQSAHANSGGMLLALYSLAAGPWMIASAALGRWWPGKIDLAWLVGFAGLLLTVTIAQWLWRVLL